MKPEHAPTSIEQEIEIARWKQSEKALRDPHKGKRAEYFKMLQDRKKPDTPLYVNVQTRKAFYADGGYR